MSGEAHWKDFAQCMILLKDSYIGAFDEHFNNSMNVIIASILLNAHEYDEAYNYTLKVNGPLHHDSLIIQAKTYLFKHKYEETIKTFDHFCDYYINTILKNPLTKPLGKLHLPEKSDQFDLSKAQMALRNFKSVLSKINQIPFLVSGTLLDYARNGGFLTHDKDIDVDIIG